MDIQTIAQHSSQVGDSDVESRLIGQSPIFQQLLNVVDAVAGNDCIVLLEGESGTGKELIARRIHSRSARTSEPFIPVNCPAVTETLFESQFYGHVKGSFTGAQSDTLGMVRAAEGGTLFLDEIGELSLHLQPKLLRLLQEREITPVGGTQTIKVNVRFIAATNRSLTKAMQQGKFRSDLYHRLNVVRLQIPPLRRRPEDIEPLLEFYLRYFAAEYSAEVRQLDASLLQQLITYAWPGNVRELCCWVERLYAANIPALPPGLDVWEDQYINGDVDVQADPSAYAPVGTGASLADTEAQVIRSTLTRTGNNRSAAAKLLNIHRTTLLRKIKQYEIA